MLRYQPVVVLANGKISVVKHAVVPRKRKCGVVDPVRDQSARF